MGEAITVGALDRGTIVGRLYRVVRVIGRGAQGDVYEVEHTKLGTRFALKLLHARSDAAAVARFEREAKTASQLAHPHIARVINFDQTEEGHVFTIMELLEGEDLAVMLERGPLTVAESCRLALQVGRALSAAHKEGVVHRDLKPANLFLVRQDGARPQVKLTDFGISKLTADADTTRITATGAVVGTPLYMAPEQASSTPVDHRVDIYALGVVLFEMLAGRPPFRAKTSQQLILEKTVLEQTDPQHILPELPKPLGRVIRRAMQRKPQDRHPTADAFVSDLESALLKINFDDHRTLQAPELAPFTDAEVARITATGRRRSGALWFALAGSVVGLACVGLVFSMTNKPPAAPPPVEAPAKVPEVVEVVPEAVVEKVTPQVKLTSDPSGADILAPDGSALGKTPLDVTLNSTGQYRVTKAGRSARVELDPDTHAGTTVHLTLPAKVKRRRPIKTPDKKTKKRPRKELKPIDVEID